MTFREIALGFSLAVAIVTILGSFQATQGVTQRSLMQQYWSDTSSNFFATTDEQQSTHKNNNKPLNIVLLYADDWRHDALGVAKTLPVQTPFLDWMSTQGVRFTHNCVTTSVCWISRVSLHLGQYLSRHGAARVLDDHWYQHFHTSFPALLKQTGYYMAHIGKWHTANFEQIEHYWDFSKIYYGKHFFPANPRPLHVTERNQRDALKVLRKRRPRDKPFMMTVAFFAPHSWDENPEQFVPQEATVNTTYQNMTLVPPVNMTESYARLPHFFSETNIARKRFHLRFDEPTKYDKMLKNYFRLITEVDAACQAIWNELEAQGILNETMVIFTTDNGFYHGEVSTFENKRFVMHALNDDDVTSNHNRQLILFKLSVDLPSMQHGLAGKWYPHEESIRVPLIVWDPRMPREKQGTTEDAITLNVDLAPTILNAADVAVPSVMQGRDISDLYLTQDAKTGWRTEFFYEYPALFGKDIIPGSTALVRKDIKV